MILEVIEPDKYERYLFRLASKKDFHYLWQIHNRAMQHSEPKEAIDWIYEALLGRKPQPPPDDWVALQRPDDDDDDGDADSKCSIRNNYDKTKLTLLEYSTVRDRVEVKKADWSRDTDEEWIVFWAN